MTAGHAWPELLHLNTVLFERNMLPLETLKNLGKI
jgi:hypothetical protein